MKISNTVISTLMGAILGAGGCQRDNKLEKNELTSLSAVLQSSGSGAIHSDRRAVPIESIREGEPVMPSDLPAPAQHDRALEDIVDSEPSTLTGYLRRGRSRVESENLEGAALDFQAAVALSADAAMPKIQLARVLLTIGDFPGARKWAQQAIDLDASSSLAWNTLGRVELSERQFDAAVFSFERAAEENEHNSYAWNNLGFTLLETGKYLQAADALVKATSGQNPREYMWNNLGMAYEHLDRIALARAAYQHAVELGSDKAQSNVNRLVGVTSLRAEHARRSGESTTGESGPEEVLEKDAGC